MRERAVTPAFRASLRPDNFVTRRATLVLPPRLLALSDERRRRPRPLLARRSRDHVPLSFFPRRDLSQVRGKKQALSVTVTLFMRVN